MAAPAAGAELSARVFGCTTVQFGPANVAKGPTVIVGKNAADVFAEEYMKLEKLSPWPAVPR